MIGVGLILVFMFIMIVFVVVVWLLLNCIWMGVYLYVVGGDFEIVWLFGVCIWMLLIWVYVLCLVFVGFVGLLFVSCFGVGSLIVG